MATTNDGDIGLNQEATDDEVKLLTQEAAEPPDKKEPAATPSPAPSPEVDEDDEDHDTTAKVDEELDAAADEAAKEAIRERRRLERAAKKQRNRERMDATDREIRALRESNQLLQQQIGSIQNHTTGTQLARLDQEIENAGKAVTHFKALIADAGTRGDGQTIADATEAMLEARDRQRQLTQIKTQVTQRSTAAPALDPQIVRHASAFMDKNKWYDPRGNDRDTQIMRIVDNEVAAAGFDMRTPEYYAELESRGRAVLPHRFGATAGPAAPASPAAPRRSPVAGSGGDGGGKGGGGANYEVSAERVKAMKEAGIWDDVERRNKLIKRYQQADKEAAAARK